MLNSKLDVVMLCVEMFMEVIQLILFVFVCCFFLALKTLVLLREVDTLKEEVRELQGVMKISGSG